MQVRKDRAHLYGTTNLDFHTVDVEPLKKKVFSPQMTHLDLLSVPKKNFDEILKSKYIKKKFPAKNPFEETYSFYKEKGKSYHDIMKIGNSREKQLEKAGGLPFIGESNVIYDERIYSDYKFSRKLFFL